jgi:3-oxoadipate enol-lactonase
MIVHHTVEGPEDAPVLVLSSSLGTTGAMWDPQVPALSERFRVVRYDMRGHGRTPVVEGPADVGDLGGDVVALLDHLGVERASFCGLSIGGMIGMWLGVHAAERLDRLVLCCTAAHLPPAEGWVDRARTVRAAGSTAPIADAVLERWFTPAFRHAHPAAVAEHRTMLLSTPVEGYATACGAIERMDQRTDLPRIAAPTLVIAGLDDPSTPPRMGEEIAAAIPGARIEILAHAAHLANVEQAEAVTALIADHVDPEDPR